MRKPYKRPFVVFTVLSFLMFAILVAAIILYPVLVLKGDILTFLKDIYFNGEIFKKLFASPISLLLLLSFIVAAVIAVLFIVLILVAAAGIKRKPAAKTVGIILAVLGIAVGYFGGTVLIHNVYYVAAFKDASGGAWKGIIDIFTAHEVRTSILALCLQAAMVLATVLYAIFGLVAIINGVKYARADLAEDQEVVPEELPEPVEEPVEEEEPLEAEPEELPVFMPEPEEDTVDPQNLSTTALAAIIKDIVREIVRDELERNNLLKGDAQPVSDSHTDNHSVVGATFGGPLIVQYFNGGIQGTVPAPVVEEPVKEEPKEEPVVEEPVQEPVKEEPKAEPVVEQPVAPVAEPVKEEPQEKEPKAPIIRIPFDERLLASEKELQETYNELKNEILSYGVKSRISSSGDTFRLHRKTYVKITVAGKSLKLYFALNPDDYRDNPIPVQDASEKGIYEEIPLVFKVKSPLSIRRCKQLIQDVMEKDNLEQGEIGTVNWIKEMKAELKARKAAEKK